MLVTQDDGGHCDIAVFTTNHPCGVEEGGAFRIDRILSVSYGNRKDSAGDWRASISVNAAVSPIAAPEAIAEIAAKKAAKKRNTGAFTVLPEDEAQLPF